MKKVLLAPLLLLIMALLATAAIADNSKLRDYFDQQPSSDATAYPSQERLVTDEAGTMTSRQIDALDQTCREIGDKYGLVVMIRLVNRTPGYTQSDSRAGYYGLRQYAADYYDARHAGEDGVIFTVRLSDRWYVSVTTGRGERALTTARLDACEDAANPYLRSGRYYDAFSAYLKKLDYYLDRYWDSSLDPSGWEPEPPTVYPGGGYTTREPSDPVTSLKESLPVIGIVSAIITGIVLLCVRHSMRTARKKEDAGNYISQARITARQDLYLYTSQTRHRIQSSSGSSSGSHGSHGSHGSGGHFGGGHSGGGGHGSSHGGRF